MTAVLAQWFFAVVDHFARFWVGDDFFVAVLFAVDYALFLHPLAGLPMQVFAALAFYKRLSFALPSGLEVKAGVGIEGRCQFFLDETRG